MPWHDCLNGFSAELATELGELLRRLAPALGVHHDASRGNELAAQGLDDLRRRGSYQRLLASEWLLADEVPDEFLRRAASGEHLFLSPAPRERQADRRIVALFHAGSWQLGAPGWPIWRCASCSIAAPGPTAANSIGAACRRRANGGKVPRPMR
ncbi:Uncharacterised protein [Chromobacterium violaceum]|uniref:Uncharacterized protein n=1 Tax=Chromobacterium violaceum TaxID=536 RepID=A0A447TEY7_CHRVL|nr:Uncharacterised protein [Chromobacterium violaceum]